MAKEMSLKWKAQWWSRCRMPCSGGIGKRAQDFGAYFREDADELHVRFCRRPVLVELSPTILQGKNCLSL